ncbi:MAG: glycosyltransferase [Lachnospiraceae bacterium]|nr:glycosyltransferase [Lachnospiraceae bacterium]
MKVLQINTVCGTGSTGRIAVDLYDKLEAQGHECLIAYGRGKAPEGIHAVRIGNDLDTYMHAAMTRITDKTGFYSRRATRKFIEKIKEYQPDLIHLHNLHGYYLDIRQLFHYIRKEQIPVVWTLHDCWPFTGHCAHFDYIGCSKWQEGCHNCPQKKEYPASKFLDHSQQNYQIKKELFTSLEDMKIITPSNWLAGLVKQSFLSKYPVEVVHNQINTAVFKPTESDFRRRFHLENPFIVLGVANVWIQKKGLQDFIKLSEQLDDSIQIILVGVNKKLKKIIPDKILTIQRTDSIKQLAEIYSAADVYLNLTYEDNYPTTNLEAHACGTTVISYQTGGSTESADLVIEKGRLDLVAAKLYELKQRKSSEMDGK